MWKRGSFLLVVPAFLAFVGPALGRAQEVPFEFEAPARIVAVGDVHGAYDNFVRALTRTGLVDDGHQWIGGASHLVQTGDVLDRGAESRKVMDLLMSLEGQAQAAGGRVHALIGNHELWNAVGHLPYVSEGELEAFATDRDEELRKESGLDAHPGELALREAYGPEGVYGRWIRKNNAAVKIGDYVFVHGGIMSPSAELGLGELNRLVREAMNETSWPTSFANEDDGPLLTRFYSSDDLLAEELPAREAELEVVLQSLGARAMIMGHTVTYGLIEPRFDGRAVLIDAGMLDVYFGGRVAALVIEGDRFSAVYDKGSVPLSRTLEGEEGALYLEAVAAASPDDAALGHWLGVVRCREGRLAEGLALHETVGVLESDVRIPYIWRRDAADCFEKAGEAARAKDLRIAYLEELGKVPGPYYWNRFARESLRFGYDVDQAFDAAARAASAAPKNAAFKETLAWAYLEKGDARRAQRVLTAARRLRDGESFESLFLMGRAHLLLGNEEQALASFRDAERVEPGRPEVEAAIAKLVEKE
ncbi:MAG TPA: metallophosphoesterase [Vicinamibacteria bacterium]|nr:metallophosphoesterase [Vicinamibacteria bacterium]